MPSIKIKCPSCKSQHSVNTRMLGRAIRCRDCDYEIQLPTAEVYEARKSAAAKAKAESEASDKQWSDLQSAVTAAIPAAAASSQMSSTKAVAGDDFDEGEPMEEFNMNRRENADDDMDMTPMVDVTFLLLIFFMITANFTMQKALQVPAEKEDQASTTAIPEDEDIKDQVTVQVDEFNAYTVLFPDGTEDQKSSKQGLIRALKAAKSADGGGGEDVLKLIVEAHQDCRHSAVVDALDAGRDQGFTKLTVTVLEELD